jgi:hypothetical protein
MALSRGFGAVILFSAACQMDMGAESTSALSHTLAWHQMPNIEINDSLEFEGDFNNTRNVPITWERTRGRASTAS